MSSGITLWYTSKGDIWRKDTKKTAEDGRKIL